MIDDLGIRVGIFFSYSLLHYLYVMKEIIQFSHYGPSVLRGRHNEVHVDTEHLESEKV